MAYRKVVPVLTLVVVLLLILIGCRGPENEPPTAKVVRPREEAILVSGDKVVFQGEGKDPEGKAVSYKWDFGDGTACPPNCGSGTEQNPTHIYTQAGDYTITLTVTDGEEDSEGNAVSVSVKTLPDDLVDNELYQGLFLIDCLDLRATIPGISRPRWKANLEEDRCLGTIGLFVALKAVNSSFTLKTVAERGRLKELAENPTLQNVGKVLPHVSIEISGLPVAEATLDNAKEFLRKWVDRLDAEIVADVMQLMEEEGFGRFEWRGSVEIKDKLYDVFIKEGVLTHLFLMFSRKIYDKL